MKNINLKVLNESEPNVLQYLPYGVTTIEMKIEGDKDKAEGFVFPQHRTGGSNEFYVGYADRREDFLIIWGAGKREGLHINRGNVNGRLFLQILHKGKDITSQKLSLLHNSDPDMPIREIKLVPAIEDANLVKMNLSQEGELCTISFAGNKMPLYYSRWFPSRPGEGKAIHYCHVDAPAITIKFKAKSDEVSTNINSDIDIFFGDEKIAQVTGDWLYSWPHAELFTVFGDSSYLVLRFWLYWIHENYSNKFFRGGAALAEGSASGLEDEQTRRGFWESLNIESPDIERFDFLIDMNKKKVCWVGTDFHYQELWHKIKDVEFVKAKIANEEGTIYQVLVNLPDRVISQLKKYLFSLDNSENYNPMEYLKEILRKQDAEELKGEVMPEIKEYTVSNLDDKGNIVRGKGALRKHIPYAEKGELFPQLVSSVVTG